MSQSLTQIYIHIVFSTKERKPILPEDALRKRLYQYIKQLCENHECRTLAIGGISDYIHLLLKLNKTTTLSTIIEKIKSSTSKWIKTTDTNLTDFYLQPGYGAFSVSQSNLGTVIHYINNQETHHKKISYQEELIKLFEAHQIKYDEKY